MQEGLTFFEPFMKVSSSFRVAGRSSFASLHIFFIFQPICVLMGGKCRLPTLRRLPRAGWNRVRLFVTVVM